jgi:hypothetical protein
VSSLPPTSHQPLVFQNMLNRSTMASPQQIVDIFDPLWGELADFRDVTPYADMSLLQEVLSTETSGLIRVGKVSEISVQQFFQEPQYGEPKEGQATLRSFWLNKFRVVNHMVYDSAISATEAMR